MATEDEGDRVVLTVCEALDLLDLVAAEMARRELDEFVEPELDAPEQTGQLLMAMCATCAHTKASHPEEGPCGETWVVDDGKREVRCRCSEYWATRRDLEDGLPVTAREISFSGGTDIEMNRRITAEFWDGLRQGRGMTVLLRASVVGKKFREKDYGLTETRQLRVDAVFFVPERREVGEPSRAFDSFGNEVDPETGEILGGGD